jgi:hypothetical protein
MISILKRKNIKYLANGLIVAGTLILVGGLGIFSWRQWNIDTDLVINSPLLSNLGSFLSGTVGILWSLASVLYFVLALKEQRKDIKTNQKAFSLQLKELEDTRKVSIEQSATLRTQRFENTFFQLLQVHMNVTKELRFGKHEGRQVFNHWKDNLDHLFLGFFVERVAGSPAGIPAYRRVPFETTDEVVRFLIEDDQYQRRYNDLENTLNHYFRQLYHIFKYVHLSNLISNEAKPFYAALVRAQLSQNELYSLAFNCFMPRYGYPNFLFLVKQYDLIQNFNTSGIPSIVWVAFIERKDNVEDPFLQYVQYS